MNRAAPRTVTRHPASSVYLALSIVTAWAPVAAMANEQSVDRWRAASVADRTVQGSGRPRDVSGWGLEREGNPASSPAQAGVDHTQARPEGFAELSAPSSAANPPEALRAAADHPSPGDNPPLDRPCGDLSWEQDWPCLLPDLWRDVECVWNRENLVCLLAAGAASWLVHDTLDDDVEDYTARHPNRWGEGQEFFSALGNPGHHFAAIAAMYMYSLSADDREIHDLSKTLLNAVAITGGATVILKASSGTGTVAPNGQRDAFGGAWPSGHTSSSFAFAAVLDEYYGPKVGIPAYILAGLVGWERIDDREHDLSDVVFGAALGYVIGRTVSERHHREFCGFEMQPYVDPWTGTTGLALERRF